MIDLDLSALTDKEVACYLIGLDKYGIFWDLEDALEYVPVYREKMKGKNKR